MKRVSGTRTVGEVCMLAARLSIAYLGAGALPNLSHRFDRLHPPAISVLQADSDRRCLFRAVPAWVRAIVAFYWGTAGYILVRGVKVIMPGHAPNNIAENNGGSANVLAECPPTAANSRHR